MLNCNFISLILFLGSISAHAQKNATEAGLEAFKNRDYELAVKLLYPKVLAANSTDKPKYEFFLGEALRNLKLNYGAVTFYARTLEHAPKGSEYLRQGMEVLGKIGNRVPLGRGVFKSLQLSKIDPLEVPPAARGFYFYNRGIDAFEKKNAQGAKAEFDQVPNNSDFYPYAQYYLGVLATTQQRAYDEAIANFQRAAKGAEIELLKNNAVLGQARVHYEKKDYKKALQMYAQVPRDSDLWLDAIFEAGWTFFMLQKHNNTLGNIHTLNAPFFINRFYPESYILQAITYLKLCRYDKVKTSLKEFQERYKSTFTDLRRFLNKYKKQDVALFSAITRFKNSDNRKEFGSAADIIDSLTRTEIFKETNALIKRTDRENEDLAGYKNAWGSSGLIEVLRSANEKRKTLAMAAAGQELYSQAVSQHAYLKDLSGQTRLINLEVLAGRTNELRSKLTNTEDSQNDSTQWGEGMRPLNIGEKLEYWPFEGEYWEDELGGYVYNTTSECNVGKAKSGDK